MRLRAALRKIHLFALGHSTGTAVSQESTRAYTLWCFNNLVDPISPYLRQLLANLLASECKETSVGCHMAGRVDGRRRFLFFTLHALRLASWKAKEIDWRRPQSDLHSQKVGFHTSGIDKFGLLELPLLLCSQVKVIRTRYIFPLTSYNKQDSNREEQSFSMDLLLTLYRLIKIGRVWFGLEKNSRKLFAPLTTNLEY